MSVRNLAECKSCKELREDVIPLFVAGVGLLPLCEDCFPAFSSLQQRVPHVWEACVSHHIAVSNERHC